MRLFTENLKAKGYLRDADVNGWVILKLILKKEDI
jgi:hypothetical protein